MTIFFYSFASYTTRRMTHVDDPTDSIYLLEQYISEIPLWPVLKKNQLTSDSEKGLSIESAFCDLG
jgi:hypothetical protein